MVNFFKYSCFNSRPAVHLGFWNTNAYIQLRFITPWIFADHSCQRRCSRPSSALSTAREVPRSPEAGACIKPFELEEVTITELQDGMKSSRFTARSLVEKYTKRIEDIDKRGPAVNAIIEMNPDAALHRARTRSRAQGQRSDAGLCMAYLYSSRTTSIPPIG